MTPKNPIIDKIQDILGCSYDQLLPDRKYKLQDIPEELISILIKVNTEGSSYLSEYIVKNIIVDEDKPYTSYYTNKAIKCGEKKWYESNAIILNEDRDFLIHNSFHDILLKLPASIKKEWYRVRPDLKTWSSGSGFCGALVLLKTTLYNDKTIDEIPCFGKREINPDILEPVNDPRIIFRRWIASFTSFHFYSNKVYQEVKTSTELVEYYTKQLDKSSLSIDFLKSLDGLFQEHLNFGHEINEDKIPGYRGDDSSYF